MDRDSILVRMPDRLDYFLAATAVVQDYCVQLHKQTAAKQRPANFWFTLEVADDGYLFFWPMFPRMNFAMRGGIGELSRNEWSCVIDLFDIDRVWGMAKTPRKHIVEAWGILNGASPQVIPSLGPMQPTGNGCKVDILIDNRVEVKDQLCRYFSSNYPQVKVSVAKVEGLRPSSLFQLLTETGMFLGMRGDATYLAATMKKPTVELYTDDVPIWWMQKPQHETYQILYGDTFSAEIVWAVMDEMYCRVAGVEEELVML